MSDASDTLEAHLDNLGMSIDAQVRIRGEMVAILGKVVDLADYSPLGMRQHLVESILPRIRAVFEELDSRDRASRKEAR